MFPCIQIHDSTADVHDRSHDYCHAPLGVSSFSFSMQNVLEMTTNVDKIACCQSTLCPEAFVLRRFIVNTIIFATVYGYCVKVLRTRHKYDKFCCGTLAKPTINRFLLQQLANMMFPRLHCTAHIYHTNIRVQVLPGTTTVYIQKIPHVAHFKI